jgi:hypothetical protein
MVTTLKQRPGRSLLANERVKISRRLTALMADLDGADRSTDEQLEDLRAQISEALKRIAELDVLLAAPDLSPLLEQATPRQRRGAARGRMLLALACLHDMPPSCAEAVKLLRNQIQVEIERIERSRHEEF